MWVVVGQVLPYLLNTHSTGVQQAPEGGAPLVLTECLHVAGTYFGCLLRAAPSDQVLGRDVGGNRIIREVFEGPVQQLFRLVFAAGADQQPG